MVGLSEGQLAEASEEGLVSKGAVVPMMMMMMMMLLTKYLYLFTDMNYDLFSITHFSVMLHEVMASAVLI